jgi:hypothetical protein
MEVWNETSGARHLLTQPRQARVSCRRVLPGRWGPGGDLSRPGEGVTQQNDPHVRCMGVKGDYMLRLTRQMVDSMVIQPTEGPEYIGASSKGPEK